MAGIKIPPSGKIRKEIKEVVAGEKKKRLMEFVGKYREVYPFLVACVLDD